MINPEAIARFILKPNVGITTMNLVEFIEKHPTMPQATKDLLFDANYTFHLTGNYYFAEEMLEGYTAIEFFVDYETKAKLKWLQNHSELTESSAGPLSSFVPHEVNKSRFLWNYHVRISCCTDIHLTRFVQQWIYNNKELYKKLCHQDRKQLWRAGYEMFDMFDRNPQRFQDLINNKVIKMPGIFLPDI